LEAKERLDKTIINFNSALQNVDHHVICNLMEILTGFGPPNGSEVIGLGMSKMPQMETLVQPQENKFLIPYDRNPHFTGRIEFFDSLDAKLRDEVEGKYNHKVAIFGLGGIGKTQIAIEYAYRSRSFYERIYWINGGDKVALVSSYVKIAGAANLCLQEQASPESVVNAVQLWLQGIQSWLMIFDNVDDITVVQGFVPKVGAREHVLITSRDSNVAGIPAEGMEVPILEPEEAIRLLHLVSDIEISPGAIEDDALGRYQ
jgi:NB-ARC domain